MPNPFARSTAHTWALHLFKKRKWTVEQAQVEYMRLGDMKGPEWRARLMLKVNNVL